MLISMFELFMDGLLNRIKEGKKEVTFEFNKDKTKWNYLIYVLKESQ